MASGISTLKSIFRRNSQSTYSPLPSSSHSRDQSLDSTNEKQSEKSFSKLSPFPPKWQPDPRTVSDATLGLSDGLTVPFALTAGLAALGDTKIVVFAGLAELMAGAISMGVGGYLGSSGEAQSAAATQEQTINLVRESPHEARAAVVTTLEPFISAPLLDSVADEITGDADKAIAFLMEHQHHVTTSDSTSRLYLGGLTIALGYLIGGLIPLLPYIFCADNKTALAWSVAVMIITLFVFGVLKTSLLGEESWRSRTWEGMKMVALGGAAAGASVLCVRLVN